ncbi:MAG: SPOR domain-containing protein [Burkholderiales bacterium]
MEQDYKPRQASKSGGSFLLGLFAGFLLGLCTAAAIAVYFFKTPVPLVDRTRTPEKSPPVVQNLTETPKAGKAEETKPRFDFYRILPGQEEPVTDKQMREAARQANKPGTPKSTYVLQAGAFPNPADADNLKARLALLGLEASVEPANLAEKGIWYRVRLGPYTSVDEINRIRQQLTQNGVDVSLVRIKDDAAKN